MRAMRRRPDVGRSTLAACEVCGRFVDVPLGVSGLKVATFDHVTDHHPGYRGSLRPLARLLDPQEFWEKIIDSYRPGRTVT